MDFLGALPAPALSIVHQLVCKAGGMRNVLALEAASKEHRLWFHHNTRFPDPVIIGGHYNDPCWIPASFWPWIDIHGHRVDHLTFSQLKLDGNTVEALHASAGVARVGSVTIITESGAQDLQALAALPNLTHLAYDDSVRRNTEPAHQGTTGLWSVLGSLTALQSLALSRAGYDEWHPFQTQHAITSLDHLAILTALTSLQLQTLPHLHTLSSLSSLAPSLQSLDLRHLHRTPAVDVLTHLTRLTRLALHTWPRLQCGLTALSALVQLQHLHVRPYATCRQSIEMDVIQLSCLAALTALHLQSAWPRGGCRGDPLDLTPLGCLTNLVSVMFHGCTIGDLQPLAASHVQTLKLHHCSMDAGHLQAAISGMSSLTALDVFGRFGVQISSLAFVSGLTRLESLGVCCGDAVRSLAPIGLITALRSLDVWAAPNVESVAPLTALGVLRSLHLERMDILTSLVPLGGLTGLRCLNVKSCASICDSDRLAAPLCPDRLAEPSVPLSPCRASCTCSSWFAATCSCLRSRLTYRH
jgi:hypothetical protein